MGFKFTKMHGLGNDFVVIDCINQAVDLSVDDIRFIANRHVGVGCDQLLLVEPAQHPNVDFNYRIFNSDGGEVEQCGNGARCFAKFVKDKGLINKDKMTIQTNSGLLGLQVVDANTISVDMGIPVLEPKLIPFEAKSTQSSYNLDVDGKEITLSVVSMGNPHAVLQVDNIDTAPVAELGPRLESDRHFPNRANIGFMQILSPQAIRLRVFERGAGETQACGTGACAAVVAGRLNGLLDETVDVALTGGHLTIQWPEKTQAVWMTGPATTVFEGYLSL